MNTAVDNKEVDQETGDLWIGCHPILQEEDINTAVDNIEVDQETGDLWFGSGKAIFFVKPT